jgi:alkylation response protein AidB-like acyl-CoA dehydrogenase
MDFELTEQQRLVRRTARDLAEEQFADDAFTWDNIPLENAKTLADHDMLAVSLPEEYGGAGMSALDAVLAMEGVGSVCPQTANTIHAACFGPSRAIDTFGTDEQKAEYLPPVAAGESVIAIAISEPEAGSHATSMTTSAEADGDEYVVNGRKAWVSDSDIADAFLTYVVLPDGHIGSLLVDRDTPGFTVADPDGNMAGEPQSELYFDDARVPKEKVLLSGPDAFKKQITAYNIERIGAMAKVWVAAKWTFDEALEYAQQREQFGQPIGEFQAVQHRLAEMAMRLKTSRLLIYEALADDELPSRIDSSLAKVYVSEACQEVVDDALQIKGAAGYVGDTPESYLYRFVRGFQIASGTNDVHRTMIAKSLAESGYPE